MYYDGFIKFLSKNWTLFEKHELSDPLLLFFILKNLYYSVLTYLNEFSIVNDSTFNSFVEDSTQENTDDHNDNLYTSSVLFSKDNLLLKESQKNLLKNLLNLDDNKEEQESYFKNFRIFYSKDSEGRHYILISESNLRYIIKTLTSILENYKTKSDLNNKLSVEKCKEYLNNFRNKNLSFNLDTLIEDESTKPGNYKLIQLSLCYFLLYINPSFSGVCKRLLKLLNEFSSKLSRKTLFNSILIVNNLIRLHPKEPDLWEIKGLLTYLWFKKFNLRIKRVVLLPNGCFGIKPFPTNLYYLYLMKTVYRLFKDKLLVLDQSFIPEILSKTPFNNSVANYLSYQYKRVVKFVVSLFMKKIKEPCNFNNLNKFNKYNKFEEFNYLNYETRYNINLLNSIFKLFYEFYKRLLRRFSFPSIFIILVNLLKERNYNKLQLSSINHRYLYESCYLYTKLNTDYEDVLRLCDEMIKKDSENSWVDNKSKLMYHTLDLNSLLKPFYFNDKLVDLVFRFKTVLIFNQHFSTWSTVLNISKICNICTNLYSDKSRVKLKNRPKFNKKMKEENKYSQYDKAYTMRNLKINKKKNKNVKILICNIDVYKSESVLIRKLVEKHSNFNNTTSSNNEQKLQNYKPRYMYLESIELCNKFDDFQIDHILNSYNQLMYILFHLFRNIYRLNRNPRFQLDLSDFEVLFNTIKFVFKYSRILQELGSKTTVLAGINVLKKVTKEYKLIMYKYHKMINNIGNVPYYLEVSLAKISLLLLSTPFRFYLYWNVSSHNKLELVFRQITKLHKLK